MKLLQLKDYKITISDDAYLIKSIRNLFNKDKTKNKDKFLDQMTFIYFYADVRSDYYYIFDEDEKIATIIADQGLPSDFKISDELKLAIDDYKKLTKTTSSSLLEDSKIAVEKIRKAIRKVDDSSIDVKSLSALTAAIKALPQISKDLIETEKIINKEIEDASRARGGNESKHIFEDGFKF